MVTVRYREISDFEFSPLFRVIISGASQTGKTHFAESLIKRQLFKCQRVYYFHPDCHESAPVEWSLDVPVIFDSEFPTVETFMTMPEFSCVVLDDLVEECYSSKIIDYLFRVLSSKRKLHVFLMAQRYYHQGRYSVSIRNSSNYHVLMRCVNKAVMSRIGTDVGLKTEVTKAIELTSSQLYPYILIDRTPKARANKCEVFIDVLDSVLVLVRGSMKYYLLAENEFKKYFEIIDSDIAKYADTKTKTHNSEGSSLVGQKENEQGNKDNDVNIGNSEFINRGEQRDLNTVGNTNLDVESCTDSADTTNRILSDTESTKSTPVKRKSKWKEQKEYERKLRRALHKYKIRS